MLDEEYIGYLDRLRYLKRSKPEIFHRLGNKTLLNFLQQVGRLPKRGRSESTISRFLTGTEPGSWLELALRESAELRSMIVEELGIGDIFAAEGRHGIDALVDLQVANDENSSVSNTGLETLHPVKCVVVSSAASQLPVSSQERASARKLKHALVHGGEPAVHWSAEPWSGATLVARSLAGHSDLENVYSQIVFLRCTDPQIPFLHEMRRLAGELGIRSSDGGLPRVLADAARQHGFLIVICDACHLPARSSRTHADGQTSRLLVAELMANYDGGPARLLTIGRSAAMEELMAQSSEGRFAETVSEELTDALRCTSARFEDYREMEGRCRSLRGIPAAMIDGSRLKRAKWHYETDQVRLDREVWPANLRLRAFFASDPSNFGYFDPTRGFEAAAGPHPWPEDIEFLHDDIVGYLRMAEAGPRQSELHALRYCSTALHWLSYAGYDALVRPSAQCPKGDVRLREVKQQTFEEIVADERTPLRAPINQFSRAGQTVEKKVFALGIGIKMLVQDHWQRSDPAQRAEAHYRIAWRLWHENQNKDVLREEFPYFPMQHRHSVFLAGETIRHLMVAAGKLADDFGHELGDVTGRWAEFPAAPKVGLQGCHPEDVVNFCYVEIYQRYINRNEWFNKGSTKGTSARALSKRHGAFGYAAELLQLMSSNGQLGSPHPALHPSFHASFIRECGYALLDLGMLSQALECFERLDLQEIGTVDRISAKFDASLVLAELGLLDQVWKTLEDAETLHGQLGDEEQRRSKSMMTKRMAARTAHLHYLEGDYGLSLMRLDTIESMTAEMIHIRLASMAHLGVESAVIAAEASNQAYRAASGIGQHEAIGFMIANAHAVRKFDPDAAENLLQTVLEEVLRTGCSERTLLRLLLEAGRILAAQGRLLRAFATYAFPCAMRARAHGFDRVAGTAEDLCYALLDRISRYLGAHSTDAWKRLITDAVKNDAKVASNSEYGHGTAEHDPLFGYFFEAPNPTLPLLLNRHGIERVRRDLRRSAGCDTRFAGAKRLQIAINRQRIAE